MLRQLQPKQSIDVESLSVQKISESFIAAGEGHGTINVVHWHFNDIIPANVMSMQYSGYIVSLNPISGPFMTCVEHCKSQV